MGLFFNKAAKDSVTLNIEGMHCAHCSSRVEAALKALPNVKKVTVNLAKKTAVVVGSKDTAAMRSAVEALGFKVV